MNRILSVTVLALAASAPTFGQTPETKADQPGRAGGQSDEFHFLSPIKGWSVAEETLDDYEIGVDRSVAHGGRASACVRSKAAGLKAGAVVLRQAIRADYFRGRRIRLSGYVKGHVTEGWAGLWMRIDGQQGDRLGLDNMKDRPIRGKTEWVKYEVVLDVPEDSIAIAFGLLLAGEGQVWMDDLELEVVDHQTVTTGAYRRSEPRPGDEESKRRRAAYAGRLNEELKTMPSRPVNTDFESPDL
ncbi:MAG TPA: hypothetical protein VFD58_00090 [Blastocatellia bacterium]|nr:hypothetical protein [Blastocatellia bacterium]